MPDFISSILMLLFWIFIVNAIGKFFKKFFGKVSEQQPGNSGAPQKPKSTFQDMMKELQRKMEEAQTGQNIPPYAKPEAVPEVPKKKVIKQQQTIVRHIETGEERERKAAAKYQQFIRQERKKEHDAEESRLTDKIYAIKPEEEEIVEPYELDLRNAIIGGIILERPYS